MAGRPYSFAGPRPPLWRLCTIHLGESRHVRATPNDRTRSDRAGTLASEAPHVRIRFHLTIADPLPPESGRQGGPATTPSWTTGRRSSSRHADPAADADPLAAGRCESPPALAPVWSCVGMGCASRERVARTILWPSDRAPLESRR